jgi:NAD(P)-dependent dehydrogenase (short-subunit alcohol dehydrogenase family)
MARLTQTPLFDHELDGATHAAPDLKENDMKTAVITGVSSGIGRATAELLARNRFRFRLDFTRIDSRYHYTLFISQAETERILRTAVEKQGGRIERGVEVVGLAQDVLSHDPNPVRGVLRHADGRLEQAQAPWCRLTIRL